MVRMVEKIKKCLYLPDWVADLLDKEGETYEGPGVVASAAITAFCGLKKNEKMKIIQNYRTEEVKRAYLDSKDVVENAAQDESASRKRT